MITRKPSVAPDTAALARSEHDSFHVAPGKLRAVFRKLKIPLKWGWGRRRRHPHNR